MHNSVNDACSVCSENEAPHAGLCFVVPQLVKYKNVAYFAYAVQ